MRLISAFRLSSYEEHLVQLHMSEYASIVDMFVICDSPEGVSSLRKPLVNLSTVPSTKLFAHVVPHLRGNTPDERESYMLTCLHRAVGKLYDDDYVYWSDADEIPNIGTLLSCVKQGGPLYRLNFRYFHGAFNLERTDVGMHQKALLIRGDVWNRTNIDVSVSQSNSRLLLPDDVTAKPMTGGWHFSFTGKPHEVAMRILCSKQTSDMARLMVAQHLLSGMPPWAWASHQLKLVPTSDLPWYIARHAGRFCDAGLLVQEQAWEIYKQENELDS